MLPFLKKKNKEGAASQTPAWHPNFRNYQRLPDIKVVRTAFFVNGGAVLAAVALAAYLGIQELKLHSTNVEIGVLEASIRENQADSDKAKALYKKFQDEEGRVHEVETFMNSKPAVSQLLQRFGDNRLKNVAFDAIDFRDVGITLRATIKGAENAALTDAESYQEQLRNDPMFASKFEDVSVNTQNRNTTTRRTPVEIFIKYKVAPAAKAPAK